MKIKVAIVDDDVDNVQLITSYLSNFENIELVASFGNPMESLYMIENNLVDVVFLEINQPKINGLNFIRSLNANPKIVITTKFSEYAIESYSLDVMDYLVKPISFKRLLKTINKMYQQVFISNSSGVGGMQLEPHVFLKVNKKLIKVNLDDILYVESHKDYIKVITALGDYVAHKSLTAITEELPQANFIRVHRSYTISLSKIIALEGNTIEIFNRKIPIGRSYLKNTKEKIFNNDHYYQKIKIS